jgi:hypothetical protein
MESPAGENHNTKPIMNAYRKKQISEAAGIRQSKTVLVIIFWCRVRRNKAYRTSPSTKLRRTALSTAAMHKPQNVGLDDKVKVRLSLFT